MRMQGRACRMRLAALLVAAASLALFPSGSSQAQSTGDTWATKASMPTARYLLGAAAASSGKLYAIGGLGNGILATVEEYDPATNTWATKAPMPSHRAGLGVAMAANGKLYAIGGEAGGILASVEEYDPATNTWASKAPMPTARRGLGVAAAANGKLYAIGGVDSIAALATVEEYDPTTNTWATKAPMPTARYYLGVAAAPNGKLYAIGGLGNDFSARVTVAEYDPATNTWATRAPMPTGRYDVAAVAAANGKVYAIGGFNGTTPALATVEQYDPATNTWATRAPMPTARYSLGVAAASNGKLYAIGGLNSVPRATVEEYDPGTGVVPTPPPATVDLTPADDVGPVGTNHTVTATVRDTSGQPVPTMAVRFSVQGSVNTTGSCSTNTSGQCAFTYTGPQLPGADVITAYADKDGDNSRDADEPQATATKAWALPTTTPGQVTGAGQVPNAAGTDQAAFGFTARSANGGVNGGCSVVDPATKTHVKCLDVTALTQNGSLATIFGNATVNGSPTTYRIDVEDKADLGRGQDTFRIQTASGLTAGGLLSQGNVQVHK